MTRKEKNYCILWVDKEYHAQVKAEAAREGKSILEYSRELARKNNSQRSSNGFRLNF